MIGQKKPSAHLFQHKMDHYTTIVSKVDGAAVKSNSLVATCIPCFIQPATDEVASSYAQRDMNTTHSVFLLDKITWQSIQLDDLLLISGVYFRVNGYHNPCGLDRVYRIDLESVNT